MSVFALEDDADFASYFDPDYGHGIGATYTPSGGSALNINIILNEEYEEIEGQSVGVESNTPVAVCRTIDVPSARHGDQLVVNPVKDLDGNIMKASTTYLVVEVQPDDTGITYLVLEEQ